jgi:hypothetical protein
MIWNFIRKYIDTNRYYSIIKKIMSLSLVQENNFEYFEENRFEISCIYNDYY